MRCREGSALMTPKGLMRLAFATWKVMLSDEVQGCGETRAPGEFFSLTVLTLLWPAPQQVTGLVCAF